jgi:hypothetical protein
MTDLKFAADGATRRYDLMNGRSIVCGVSPSSMEFVAHIGPYDLHWDKFNECYTVVKEDSGPGSLSYNFTDYHIKGANLEATDKDVILDPYHMGLLYLTHEHYGYRPTDEK